MKNQQDPQLKQYGTHAYTRGPQVLVSSNGVRKAKTLTQARKMRIPGEKIVSLDIYNQNKTAENKI